MLFFFENSKSFVLYVILIQRALEMSQFFTELVLRAVFSAATTTGYQLMGGGIYLFIWFYKVSEKSPGARKLQKCQKIQ